MKAPELLKDLLLVVVLAGAQPLWAGKKAAPPANAPSVVQLNLTAPGLAAAGVGYGVQAPILSGPEQLTAAHPAPSPQSAQGLPPALVPGPAGALPAAASQDNGMPSQEIGGRLSGARRRKLDAKMQGMARALSDSKNPESKIVVDKIAEDIEFFYNEAGPGILGLIARGVLPSDLFAHYDAQHEVYVIPDRIMAAFAQAAGLEKDPHAANFEGRLVFMRESSMEKLNKGDKIERMALRHEKLHTDYRRIHGKPKESERIQRALADELHAYFASFIEVYGAEKLPEPWVGERTYYDHVFKILSLNYLNDVTDQQTWKDLVMDLEFVIGRINESFRKGKIDSTLARLKQSVSLRQVLNLDPFFAMTSHVGELVVQGRHAEAAAAIEQFKIEHPDEYRKNRLSTDRFKTSMAKLNPSKP